MFDFSVCGPCCTSRSNIISKKTCLFMLRIVNRFLHLKDLHFCLFYFQILKTKKSNLNIDKTNENKQFWLLNKKSSRINWNERKATKQEQKHYNIHFQSASISLTCFNSSSLSILEPIYQLANVIRLLNARKINDETSQLIRKVSIKWQRMQKQKQMFNEFRIK